MPQTLQHPSPDAASGHNDVQPRPVQPLPQERHGLERFFDNFFREENIKWMSVIGAAIVLGSSLMLVSHQWKSWPAEIKYLAILGYTIGAYGCAQLARYRFGLTTTANVLRLLTLLLIPLCFIALSWLPAQASSPWIVAETIGLMVPAVLFMRYASLRIFDDLLRGRQATFAYSYMLLSVAGALAPLTDVVLAGLFSVACWLIMSIGVMKVNRHVFWMAEEYKQPRVFAFFPIALLGAQFLVLVAMKSVNAIPYEWLGMGSVMVAATVLLTARAVAEVFKQRTGDLVRPLPWNLVVPLIVGLALVASGVAMSFYGFSLHGQTTVALVPTALLAGALLCVVAWDTGLSGFVWAGLVLFTLAYQTSPTLIAGLVQQMKEHAAAAVHESTLPVAFYGITYLPLIVVMMIASRYCAMSRRVGSGRFDSQRLQLFSAPLRHFATVLTVGLFALAAFNLKSLAIVSILDVPLLLSMAVLFRDRRYAYSALASLVLASVLVVPLFNAMGWADISPWHTFTSIAALGMFLVSAPGIDRTLLRIPIPGESEPPIVGEGATRPLAICMIVGYTLALALSAFGTVLNLAACPNITPGAIVQAVLLLVTLLVATVRTRDYLSAISLWILASVATVIALANWQLPLNVVFSATSIAAASISLIAYGMVKAIKRRSPAVNIANLRQPSANHYTVGWRASSSVRGNDPLSGRALLAATLAVSLSDLSLAIAVCLAALFHIPFLTIANFAGQPLMAPLATSFMLVWAVAIAYLYRSRIAGAVVGAVLPLWGWGMLTTLGIIVTPTVPSQVLVWMVTASSAALAASVTTGRTWQAASAACQAWVAALTILSLFNADPVFRIVGILGLAIGYALHGKRLGGIPGTFVAILTNLHLFILVMSFSGIEGWIHQWMLSPYLPAALVTLLPLLGLSMLLFDTRSLHLDQNACIVWSSCLRCFALGAIVPAFILGGSLVHLMPVIVLGFVMIAIAEFIQAIRLQLEFYVWIGLCALGAAGLWLAHVGIIELGIGISQLSLVLAAAVGLLLSHLSLGHARFGIFARPMQSIGLICPALLTGMAIAREVSSPVVGIDPINTLTMFGAAALYFHQGLARKERRYLLLSVAILNVAFMLTWRGLHIHDAQFYCVPVGLSIIAIVQLLKRELPKSAHDPLRYAGALVMLVSPLFAIVGGSWLHLFTLLALCVFVILLAIGLRLRALVHTGTAFLLADLVMMVVRSSIDHPSLLWVCGLGLGGAVIVLAAVCERHREQVLSRIRMLTAELATWN